MPLIPCVMEESAVPAMHLQEEKEEEKEKRICIHTHRQKMREYVGGDALHVHDGGSWTRESG